MKMHAEDRESAIDDFKTPNFIFTIGFLVVGAFLATLGNAFTVYIIKAVGIVFSGLGGITSFIFMWRENKIKSISILSLRSEERRVGKQYRYKEGAARWRKEGG